MIHYHPLDFQPFKAEFVAPVAEDYFIWWLFRHKCVKCRQSASEINEIIPRGRTKNSIKNWRNRVTLCRTCHTAYHNNGVTNEKIADMQKARRDMLIMIGREAYLGEMG